MKNIVILGQTATGKTKLGIFLLPLLIKLPGITGIQIVSADSKQVYQGQDIVTGKDKPAKLPPNVRLWGIDATTPDKPWSVSHFAKLVKRVVSKYSSPSQLLLIVGGTGLYIQSLFNPPASMNSPILNTLRRNLDKLLLTQLQKKLESIDPQRFKSLNHSDRHNPRRLVRAIEIASLPTPTPPPRTLDPEQTLFIGIKVPGEILASNIERRVRQRLKNGAVEETKKLMSSYATHWHVQASSAIGYPEIQLYLSGKINKAELEKLWILHELQYAKRQMVWFNKQPNITWFDATSPNLLTDITQKIKTWYTANS